MCNITYRGVAVSTPEGRTTVSYDTTYRVDKELLSQVLNTVLRVRERDSRQVGDPFIAPYLAGVYQRLGLEYSSLLCFTRLTLLWRRITAARAAAATTAGVASVASTRPAARVASMDWHVQQLHRELVLEPWKAADLRLMLGRAAAFAEVQVAASGSRSAGACSATAGGGGVAGGGLSSAGIPGPWLPRHSSALVGGGMRVGGYAGDAGAAVGGSDGVDDGGGREDVACDGSPGLAALGQPGGVLAAVLFWALWATCPTMLVALEAMQAAPDNPWMALYICVIATCRTMAEWRAAISVVLAPGLTVPQRLYGMAVVHLASGLASAVVTGLLNTWLPLLGHGAAAAVVWLHLLLLPAVMVAVMSVAGMPAVARQLAGGNGGAEGSTRRQGVRDRRHITVGAVRGGGGGGGGPFGDEPLAGNPAHRPVREGDRGGRPIGGGGAAGGSGTGIRGSVSAAAAAAAAQVHWPPALEVPPWLDDWPNAPEAFRCPITQSLMREPAQASSGVTYERPAIMQWLEHRRVDPVTHVPLKRHRLAPNLNLRHMIEVWVQDRVEARRRLAQRLREEMSAEVAALAAAEAAAAAAATASTVTRGDGPPASEPATVAESDTPGATATEPCAAEAAAAGARPLVTQQLSCSGGAADGALAAGEPAPALATPDAAPAASSAAIPLAAAAESPCPAAAGASRTLSGGVLGGSAEAVPEPGLEAPGSGGAAVQVRVEEVEALALAAARARLGCRHRCPGLGDGACGGSGGGGLLASARGFSGEGRPFHDGAAEPDGGDTDGVVGVRDGGASTPGSAESPFAVLPVAQDSSGPEADTEPGAEPPGAESGGGEGSNLYLYDTAFGADDGSRLNTGGGVAEAVAAGLRRRRRAHLGPAGTGLTAAPAVGALPREPSWSMVWDGADPDSSGVLAADGSATSTAAAAVTASAPASRDGLTLQDQWTHHHHHHHHAPQQLQQQQHWLSLSLQPQHPHPPHGAPQPESRSERGSNGEAPAASTAPSDGAPVGSAPPLAPPPAGF